MGSVRAETERGSAGVHAVDPPPKANRDGSTRWKRLVTDRALVKCVLSEALRQGVCGAYQTASPLGQSRGPHGTRPTAFRNHAAALRLSPDLGAAAPRGLAAQSADAHSTGCTASRCAQPSARQVRSPTGPKKRDGWSPRRYWPPSPGGPLVGELVVTLRTLRPVAHGAQQGRPHRWEEAGGALLDLRHTTGRWPTFPSLKPRRASCLLPQDIPAVMWLPPG